MSASIEDISISIISNNKEAYYSSYKGIGNILWEIDFGLYSDEKPDPFKIFDFAENTLWNECINKLDKPLIKPTYGILVVNFDNKTIIDNNGYGSWNIMYLDWFINCIFRFANREMEGWTKETVITKKTIIEQLKNGNIYIGNRFQKPSELILPDNIQDAYELFVSLGYDDYTNRPISVINKGYNWAQIKSPKDWKILKEL